MSEISFINHQDSIILDFPHKDSVLYDDISHEKSEKAFISIENHKNRDKLFSPKQFHNWSIVSSDTMQPISQLSIDNNFLFKGNNLIVLHSIAPIFQNKIKLIYIDPPYNTGNTFIYKDKFSRAEWLLFMKNRLEISRLFLQEDGILVIQCDENEHAYLKILLDELYGEENFLGSITVLTNPSGRDYRSLARTHEYLLVYGNRPEAQLYPLILDKEFKFEDNLGGFDLRSLRNGNIRFHEGNRPNLHYPFYVNSTIKDSFEHHPVSTTPKKGWIEVRPRMSQGINTVWRWGKEKAENNIKDNTLNSNLIARKSKDSFLIFEKYRNNTRLARTIWDEKSFHTTKGTKHIKQMFGESVFDYPKPEELIARIIDITTKKGDRVMDFFLGSGTTAAVAHKAGRKWIGIEQLDYIETVTIPRLQKMLSGEEGGASSHYHWKGGGDFVYTSLLKRKDAKFPYYADKNDKDGVVTSFYELK